MNADITLLLAILCALFIIAPHVFSWRIKRFGSAVTSESSAEGPIFTSLVTVKGQHGFMNQSILCRMNLYNDRIGFRVFWAPERFIRLDKFRMAERLLRGARTTGIRMKPADPSAIHELLIVGIADVPKFIEFLREHSKIECTEVDDNRSPLDLIR